MELLIVKDKRIDYDGSAIQSHWTYRNFGILGNSLVVFRGKCDVKVEEMIDIEDLRQNKEIKSDDMVHYIIEVFDFPNVLLASALQKLFMAKLCEVLGDYGIKTIRKGDDIYVNGRKLSISIATVSPVSIKIHIGINVEAKGIPEGVEAIGLKELGIEDIGGFMEKTGKALVEEFKKVKKDSLKVRWAS
ncbi:hypothetical protein, conserved [Thermococcus onnurineus NA1]|uniref:DUF366 domain-containing protein n=1 Tax=Thermococcus onnurineus (strain NA1) TaxID=523850 RepID=B6YXS7_THEON|nr:MULTISPECIES: DUF366 family protein [Thermococcus]ACJ16890.1 hypothetical protein, conserved [Thermococcus onnurineus NA1]NJE46772.1 DUF366 family protein [Thermococcus sp. GR7]NJE77800.1 DUF366 family protein [Thermococcus sp. GR4]NJF22928.1 DUF366 family protein [Thermococcus sp. GR5]